MSFILIQDGKYMYCIQPNFRPVRLGFSKYLLRQFKLVPTTYVL